VIQASELVLDEVIGDGAAGVVVRGVFAGRPVAASHSATLASLRSCSRRWPCCTASATRA
jgi:hypothetical protein